MALLPQGIFNVQATFDQAKFTNITGSIETRQKVFADEIIIGFEEIRTVITIEMELTVEGVSDVFIEGNSNEATSLSGTLRGGPQMTISFDSAYWEGSGFRLASDRIAGLGDEGSTQAVLVQTWVAVSLWEDAPWNPTS